MRCARVEHLAADELDVVIGTIGVLRGHHMRAQEGGLIGHGARCDQGARLVMDGEPITGLRLEGGGALLQRFGRKPGGIGRQLLVTGGASRSDGGADASGGVRRAGHARIEFCGPIAREDGMHMGIDESGKHRSACHVVGDIDVGEFRCRADPGDASIDRDDRGIAHDPERAFARGRVGGGELPDIGPADDGHEPITSRMVRSSSAAASIETWAPSRTRSMPATTTVRTSAGAAA